ncbi:MAG: hypothetical protein ABI707_11955 [Ferruginibacter sp.]
MKTHHLFCCLLTLITCCIFTWIAESALGIVLGCIAIIISMAVFSKNIMGKLVRRRSN